MIHFDPQPQPQLGAAPYAEAVARLASLRAALRLVDPAATDASPADEQIAAAWTTAGHASRRCFAARSERTIGAAAAGIEAVLAERSAGREPTPRSVERVAEEIRAGLEDLQRLLSR